MKIGELIKLRKFLQKDIDRIMEIFPDKKITDGIGITLSNKPPKITRKFEKTWLKKTISNYRKKKPKEYNLAITLDNILIGSIGMNKIDYENKNLEVGYWIGREYWGKGYATKALRLFLDFVDKKYQPKRVYGFAFTFNPGSRRVMEKCGFKLEGIRKNIKKGIGKFYDDYMLALTK